MEESVAGDCIQKALAELSMISMPISSAEHLCKNNFKGNPNAVVFTERAIQVRVLMLKPEFCFHPAGLCKLLSQDSRCWRFRIPIWDFAGQRPVVATHPKGKTMAR